MQKLNVCSDDMAKEYMSRRLSVESTTIKANSEKVAAELKAGKLSIEACYHFGIPRESNGAECFPWGPVGLSS